METEALKVAVDSLGGDFELIRELGRGATSVVYLLRDHGLNRDIALKVIRGGFGTDEEALARLQREAHLVAQLQHPNIVKLFGTHRLPDGGFALLMEHVPGRNLKEVLTKEGALPITRVLSVLKDVASALAYAHRRRIVHRDVKPENIYIDEEVDAARLADFGVARPWDQDSRLTLPGASLGTPAYMSPEQIDGKEVDGRSDVYSLGLVGYEMVLGRHPWEGENVFTTIFKQKNTTLPMDLPAFGGCPALAEILEKSLEKSPESRWESAEAMLQELRTVVPQPERNDLALWQPWAPEGAAPGDTQEDDLPEGGEDTEWNEEDWEDEELGDDEPLPIKWLDLPEVKEEEGAVADQADSSPVVARKKWQAVAFWVGSALILMAGSYGAYQWTRSAQGGSAAELTAEPASTTPPEFITRETATPADPPVLSVMGGDLQGRAGSATTLVVRASGPDGSPFSDTNVLFRLVDGGGTLEAEMVRTGEGGLAEAVLRLPTQAGEVVVEATLPGFGESSALFRIEALPGPPVSVAPITGDGQTAAPGEALPESVGIGVRDEFGNPIPNTPVSFRVLEGDGAVQPVETATDPEGRAFTRWTLGSSPGPQSVAAMVFGIMDSLVTFHATAQAPDNPEQEPEGPEVPPAPVPARVLSQTFAIGGSHVCSLTGGRVVCRGGLESGQSGGSSMRFRALFAGVSHGCGLQQNGVASCWGANESGQLGDGTFQDRRSPVLVDTDLTFSLLVGGLSHTCGLDGRGTAICWGRNLNGQLGDGSRTDRSRPAPVSGDASFESLTAGWNHTCGLTSEGRAYCWGLNGDGQLGDGTRVDRLIPIRVAVSFNSLAAGAGHTCGISRNRVLCWGDNRFGQLGNGGAPEDMTSPAAVLELPSSPPTRLAVGAVHTCVLLTNGETYCWGQNLYGQLGNGTTENSAVPVAVAGGLRFRSLFAGGGVTCGFTEDGSQYCWGMNQGGQLGDGTRTNRSSPVLIGGGSSSP
jgi:alpha-tubulin suppressor-like RCC1 family protein